MTTTTDSAAMLQSYLDDWRATLRNCGVARTVVDDVMRLADVNGLLDPAKVAAAQPAPGVTVEAIASEARRYAAMYPEASDGRNTFIMFAEWVERQATHAPGVGMPGREETIRLLQKTMARRDLEPLSETTLALYRADAEHAADALLAATPSSGGEEPNREAIELAYGLLWVTGSDRGTKAGEAHYQARKTLYDRLDKSGQARGIVAANTLLGRGNLGGGMGVAEAREASHAYKQDRPEVMPGSGYREAEPWEGRGTVTKAFCREAARACLTAALGESYVVVPREPTTDQRNAGVSADDKRTGNETCAHIYRAMLSAAVGGEG